MNNQQEFCIEQALKRAEEISLTESRSWQAGFANQVVEAITVLKKENQEIKEKYESLLSKQKSIMGQ